MRNIQVGKKYMLIHGHNKGCNYIRSPSATNIDLSVPVTVLSEDEILDDGETCWCIEYTTTYGAKLIGWAWDRSFGEEVK